MHQLRVLVGTTKGAFFLECGPDRKSWSVRGPFCDGWPINHVIGDAASGQIWAGGGSEWHGAGVWRSDDDGATWELSQVGLQDGSTSIWSLGQQPAGRIFAGAKPAALFESDNGGKSWMPVSALNDDPERENWQPGAAGLVLHTIVADTADHNKLWVGISAVGVFATEDGGLTWDKRNRRSNLDTVEQDHHADGEVGICVHNIVQAPGVPGLLYQQNHHGVYHSRDSGHTWTSISAGLPSTFGFPVAVHPRDPQMLWVFPLNGDSIGRYPNDAAAAVWRSADGGESWHDMRDGLPQKDCYFTVLRQAMAVDQATPAGVYFGTNTGSVFASADEGASWTEIARHLPTVLSVEVMALQP